MVDTKSVLFPQFAALLWTRVETGWIGNVPAVASRKRNIPVVIPLSVVIHFFINVRRHLWNNPVHQILHSFLRILSFVCHEMGYLAGYRLDCMPCWRKIQVSSSAGGLNRKIPGNTRLHPSIGKLACSFCLHERI